MGSRVQDRKLGAPRGRRALALGRMDVEDGAAAHGAARTCIAQYEAVADRHGGCGVEHDLRVGSTARRQGLLAEHEHARVPLGGSMMQLHAQPLGERARLARE